MSTPTVYMGLPNPTVGGDANVWGGFLNTCITGFDTLAVYNVVPVAANATLGIFNGPALIKATAGVGGITLTLPDATIPANKGRVYNVVKVDAAVGTVTLSPFGGQTISGQASVVISTQWFGVVIQSDGANWIVLDFDSALPVFTSNGVLIGNGTNTPTSTSAAPPNSILTGGTSAGIVGTQLLTAASYAILGASGVSNTGASLIAGGNVGSFPTNTITGLTGANYTAPAQTVTAVSQNQTDLQAAIVFYQGLTPSTSGLTSFGTTTFTAVATGYAGGPGFVGNAASTLHFTGGTITLDGAGLTNPVFVFQVGSALNVDTATTTFNLINNATAANVVFVVTSSAVFDAHPHIFSGNILASTSITLNGGTLTGRALAHTGAVTLSSATNIVVPAGGSGAPSFSSTPTLTSLATVGAIVAGTTIASASLSTTGFISVGSTISSYNGQVTAGNGIASIVAATSQKSESAADANVLTFTPPALAGTYRVRFVLSVSAAAAAVLGWTATWTDSNGNAQTPTNLALSQAGTAPAALTFTTSSAGNYYGFADIDINNAATPIVIKFTLTGGTITAKASATIERMI
jgi:hypothetical protein